MDKYIVFYLTFKQRLMNTIYSIRETISNILSKIYYVFISITLRKLINSFCTCVLFCQLLQLTIDYTQYYTVIDMKVGDSAQRIVPLTLCIDSKRQLNKNFSENLNIGEYMRENIFCAVYYKNKTFMYTNCSDFTSIVESVTPFAYRCLTYFSQLFDSITIQSDIDGISLIIDKEIDVFGFLHPIKTPPHLLKNKFNIKSSFNLIDFSLIEENLLPFPYETDCYYEFNSKSLNGYQSKEECIVKSLQIQEYKSCKCNNKWLFSNLSIEKHFNVCDKCDFDFAVNRKVLRNNCRKNCKNQYIDTRLKGSAKINHNKNIIYIYKSSKSDIIFTHLPKMNLIEYLCLLEALFRCGLESMYFI